MNLLYFHFLVRILIYSINKLKYSNLGPNIQINYNKLIRKKSNK